MISTFDGVMNVLGGFKAIAALTGVTSTVVRHWRRAGRFPADTRERIEAELVRKGVTAPRHLWNFDPPRTYDRP